MASGEQGREQLFQLAKARLEGFAYKIVANGLENNDFVVVCIDMGDFAWRDVAEILMPDQDLSRCPNGGKSFVAMGVARATICDSIARRIPDIAHALHVKLPAGFVRAIILGFGGAAVRLLEPIPAGTTALQNRPRLPYSYN